MRIAGVAALILGATAGAWVVRSTEKFVMDFVVNPDGSVEGSSAGMEVDDDTRYPPDVLRDLKPGDRGRWTHAIHRLLPLRYDVYRVEREGEDFGMAIGRVRYWLLVGGISAAPLVLWLIASVAAFVLGKPRKVAQP